MKCVKPVSNDYLRAYGECGGGLPVPALGDCDADCDAEIAYDAVGAASHALEIGGDAKSEGKVGPLEFQYS